MIVPRAPQLWQMIRYVGRPLLLLAGYDLLVVVAYQVLGIEWVALPHIPLALYGSAIGIILSFRNNSAYARWWEARTLWGAIVNNTRSWARQVVTSVQVVPLAEQADFTALRRRMVHHQIAYVHALRAQLRGLPVWPEVERVLPGVDLTTLKLEQNVALALQVEMANMLATAVQRNWVSELQWRAMDENLNDLADAQGGAERIKNTPMPKQYDYFPRLFVQIYCFMLPLALVTDMGWFTPLGSTLVGFIFLALDKIGRDLEDPFDNDIYDVPVTAISKTIEINLRQMLGETELPAPEVPVKGVLW